MKYSTISSTKQRLFFNQSEYESFQVDESLPITPNSIPSSCKELHLDTNQSIVCGSIPNSVETLVIRPTYKRDLPSNVLPSSIHSIIFNAIKRTDQTIKSNSLPSNLKNLIIASTSSLLLEKNSIPDSLECLKISGNFQQELSLGLFSTSTSSLTHLDLDPYYNIPISSPGILPSNLKILKWGQALILPNVIPEGVEFIRVGPNWNQKIQANTFPQSLRVLKLISAFNTFIDCVLPKKLEYLKFGSSFDQPLNLSYLSNLSCLILGWNYNRELTNQSIPESIQFIKFGKAQNRTIRPNILPSKSLTSLYFSSASLYTSHSPHDQGSLVEGSIPSSVKCVQFENGYPQYTKLPNCFMPSTVEYLDLGKNFNSILKRDHFSTKAAESQLKVLILSDSFDIKFTNEFYIPEGVLSLTIGHKFHQEFDKESAQSLPKSLVKLELGPEFDYPLDNLSLTNIEFLVIRNQKYSHINSIPSNIKYISRNGLFSSVSYQDQLKLSTIQKYELYYIKPKISLNYPKHFEINTKINLFK